MSDNQVIVRLRKYNFNFLKPNKGVLKKSYGT